MTTRTGSIAEDHGRTPEDSTSADSYSTASPGAERKGPKRKREQVATACGNCRMAKLRCNGRHPTCERCRARSLTCTYDVAVEGLTRREYLRLQFEEQKEVLERCNVVMGGLVNGTDKEAAELLARLRMGDSVEQLYRRLTADEEVDENNEPVSQIEEELSSTSAGVRYTRPVLPPLDVKFHQYEDDPEAGLRALALSSARESFHIPATSSELSAEVSPRQYIQDEAFVFPTYQRQRFNQECLDPSLFDNGQLDGSQASRPTV